MAIEWVDLLAAYFFGLKYLAIATAILILILGLDDLLVDLAYWGRATLRFFRIYLRQPRADGRLFDDSREQPIAIMLPAWKESEVIGSMLSYLIQTLDYENYHVFVGTYPNDAETQSAVDSVTRHNANIHKVICARPGPTTKADCLNNVLQAIFRFEDKAGLQFQGFVLHDAEDLIGAMELRLFNHLLPRKDMIQLPVYPLPTPWHHFTSWHYADEFAEQHSKDLVVREALSGQVPSAGVGTCFSRRAMLHLMGLNDGSPFDVHSLTEDYEIALRLHQAGMKQVFVRFPSRQRLKTALREGDNVLAIQEYFPEKLSTAVRQKSRWIIGIMLQGWRNTRWQGSAVMRYFLWRDRRGLIGHPTAFMANFLLLNILGLLGYQWLAAEPYRFMPIFSDSQLLIFLLYTNAFVLLNRVLHRMWFVGSFYGPAQALLAVPRLFWSNLINFLAMTRALKQFLAAGKQGRLQWDKTSHAFPEVQDNLPSQALGAILIGQGELTEEELSTALIARQPWERLGQTLLRLKLVSAESLARALAQQADLPLEHLDPRHLSPEQRELISAPIARRYSVLPLREEGETLWLASERPIPEVQRMALQRRLKRPVQIALVPQGAVTVALRCHYMNLPEPHPIQLWRAALPRLKEMGVEAETIWQHYVSGQYLLGDNLVMAGLMEPGVAAQALLDYEHSDQPFGEFLVARGFITQATLDEALQAQSRQQPNMTELLKAAGIQQPEALLVETRQ